MVAPAPSHQRKRGVAQVGFEMHLLSIPGKRGIPRAFTVARLAQHFSAAIPRPARSVIRRNEGEETKEFGKRTGGPRCRSTSSEDLNELRGGTGILGLTKNILIE